MEIELADVSHTDRVSNTRELTFLFPEKSKQPLMPASQEDPCEDPPKQPQKYSLPKQPANTPENNDVQSELTRLRSHATQLVKAMQHAVKAKDPVPLSHANHEIDGIHLVHRTSWGWRAASSNSRLREFQTVAGAAVLEWDIIEEYRPEVLKPGSGAQYLRCILLSKINLFSKPSSIVSKRAQFTFADQVVHEPVTGHRSFPIGNLLVKLREKNTLKSDATTIQNLVKMIERCPFTWRDPDNEDDVKSPPINQEIDQCLRTFVKVN